MSTQIKPVTIPREVADAIERKRDRTDGLFVWTNEDFAVVYTQGIGPTQVSLRKIPFDTLMRALTDGYERELTEEEKREKAYENIRECFAYNDGSEYERGFDDGVLFVLRELDIAITGVNDAPYTEVTA